MRKQMPKIYVNIKLLAFMVVYNAIGKSITDSLERATSPAVVKPMPINNKFVLMNIESVGISDISSL